MPDSQPTVGFLLNDVARFLRKRFEQNARGLGLTRSNWQVLVYLSRCEGIHQGGLAEILEIEPITLVRIVDKLEARGLIERRQHPKDRRAWQLYLTDQARPIVEEARRLGEMTRGEALAGIPEKDREQLMKTLLQMKKNLVEACAQPTDTDEASNG